MRAFRFALPLLVSTTAFAASFNCKLASTPREKTICASPALSKADDELAAKYKALHEKLSPESAADLLKDQRIWLAYLDKACAPNLKADRANISECLLGEYNSRKPDFDSTTLPSGQVLFTRATYIARPTKLVPNDDSDMDPGVGTGIFRWPQIDRATSQQTAFNHSVLAYLLESSKNDPKQAATFLASTDPHSSVDVSWTLRAVNDKLLSIDFEQFSMTYGAAHPNTFDSTFHWNVAAGRPLQVTDVFNNASGWSTKLIPAARQKLRAIPDMSEMLWNGDELTKGIGNGLSNSYEWTLSSKGFTVTFAQYQVAAYVAGMPDITFTWQELKPYLNPSFAPSGLPKPTTSKRDSQ
ncbi:MAG: lysozyme inhibitor LprI family protein [Acidobacteriaceae bacterium]|nr:lysozyme inhibitor LprI family protein [Acidobacteriaceae bacterium]